jgi:hypothetical protein
MMRDFMSKELCWRSFFFFLTEEKKNAKTGKRKREKTAFAVLILF